MRRGILADLDTLRSLGSRISQRPFDEFYDVLTRRCGLILQSSPMIEMNWQAAWSNGRQNAALTTARGSQGRIFDLVIADAIDSNEAFRSRAVEELMNLVNWSTWVDPSRTNLTVDLCTAEAGVAAVVGLDWLWDCLSEAQREKIIATLNQRVIEPYCQSVQEGVWWYSSVNHWGAVINSACGLVALAMDDQNDRASQAYDLARTGLGHFFDDLGREGGWDEGLGYWGYALRYVLLFGLACDGLLDDQKLLHHRGMVETGLFPIYFSPNGRPASFGDSAKMPLHGALYLLARYFDRDEITWWLDTYSFQHDVTTTEWSQAGLALLLRPDSPQKTAKAPELEPVKVFHQIGWAAMADNWPRPDFYVAAKTGDLATSHAQHDMNSLQMQVDGEMMLVDLGHPPDEGSDYFSLARGGFYEIQARSHNTIVVAEEDHRPDAQGLVRDSRAGDEYRWVVCDAENACGDGVRFLRHVVMLLAPGFSTGQSLIVLDELNLPRLDQVDMFWHTGGKIDFDEKTLTGQITGQVARLNFALAASAPAMANCSSRALDYGRADRYVQLSANLAGQQYFASVFSRKPIKAGLQICTTDAGGVEIICDKTVVAFEPGKRHLNLASVKQTSKP